MALIVALILQFPTGRGYYPVARALADVVFGDVGHGPRAFWIAEGLLILAVYTCAVFWSMKGLRLLLRARH